KNDERNASERKEALVVETEVSDRNVSFGNFQVIRQNMQQAVLIELGFISNHKSEELLLTNAYQSKLINGIISGLEKYFTSQYKEGSCKNSTTYRALLSMNNVTDPPFVRRPSIISPN